MIEVFKTNVERTADASQLVQLLLHHFPGRRINFDLDDCDKILRIEGQEISNEEIIGLVNQRGFRCSVLD